MFVPARTRRAVPIRIAGLAVGLGLALASAPADATPQAEAAAASWVGRYCTPHGCRGAADSALGNALGFAGAAAAIFLTRRRRA